MDLLTRTGGYTLRLADGAVQVEAAQRLRHDVLPGELGATLRSTGPGLDHDGFDDVADHLIVRDDATGAVVGTYRMLPHGRSSRRYGDTRFDLRGLDPLRDVLVEAGRSCVHPDHRTGAVVTLMWTGIARYLHRHTAGRPASRRPPEPRAGRGWSHSWPSSPPRPCACRWPRAGSGSGPGPCCGRSGYG